MDVRLIPIFYLIFPIILNISEITWYTMKEYNKGKLLVLKLSPVCINKVTKIRGKLVIYTDIDYVWA